MEVFWKAGFRWLTENSPWFCCHFVQTGQENGWAQGLLCIKWSLNMVAWEMNSGGSFKNLTKPRRNRKGKKQKERTEERDDYLVVNSTGCSPEWREGSMTPIWELTATHNASLRGIWCHPCPLCCNEPSIISVEGNLIHDAFIKQTAHSSSNGLLSIELHSCMSLAESDIDYLLP